MSGKVVSFATGSTYSVAQLLEIVDSLRESIIDGEVIAFAAVGVMAAGGPPSEWAGATRPVSPLTLLGAITKLQHSYADKA